MLGFNFISMNIFFIVFEQSNKKGILLTEKYEEELLMSEDLEVIEHTIADRHA